MQKAGDVNYGTSADNLLDIDEGGAIIQHQQGEQRNHVHWELRLLDIVSYISFVLEVACDFWLVIAAFLGQNTSSNDPYNVIVGMLFLSLIVTFMMLVFYGMTAKNFQDSCYDHWMVDGGVRSIAVFSRTIKLSGRLLALVMPYLQVCRSIHAARFGPRKGPLAAWEYDERPSLREIEEKSPRAQAFGTKNLALTQRMNRHLIDSRSLHRANHVGLQFGGPYKMLLFFTAFQSVPSLILQSIAFAATMSSSATPGPTVHNATTLAPSSDIEPTDWFRAVSLLVVFVGVLSKAPIASCSITRKAMAAKTFMFAFDILASVYFLMFVTTFSTWSSSGGGAPPGANCTATAAATAHCPTGTHGWDGPSTSWSSWSSEGMSTSSSIFVGNNSISVPEGGSLETAIANVWVRSTLWLILAGWISFALSLVPSFARIGHQETVGLAIAVVIGSIPLTVCCWFGKLFWFMQVMCKLDSSKAHNPTWLAMADFVREGGENQRNNRNHSHHGADSWSQRMYHVQRATYHWNGGKNRSPPLLNSLCKAAGGDPVLESMQSMQQRVQRTRCAVPEWDSWTSLVRSLGVEHWVFFFLRQKPPQQWTGPGVCQALCGVPAFLGYIVLQVSCVLLPTLCFVRQVIDLSTHRDTGGGAYSQVSTTMQCILLVLSGLCTGILALLLVFLLPTLTGQGYFRFLMETANLDELPSAPTLDAVIRDYYFQGVKEHGAQLILPEHCPSHLLPFDLATHTGKFMCGLAPRVPGIKKKKKSKTAVSTAAPEADPVTGSLFDVVGADADSTFNFGDPTTTGLDLSQLGVVQLSQLRERCMEDESSPIIEEEEPVESFNDETP